MTSRLNRRIVVGLLLVALTGIIFLMIRDKLPSFGSLHVPGYGSSAPKKAAPKAVVPNKSGSTGSDLGLDSSQAVASGNRNQPVIALTFTSNLTKFMQKQVQSDPKVSYNNMAVLDVLDQSKVPATFFLSGLWAQQYKETAARIAANPRFEVASHSYANAAFVPKCYTLPDLPKDQKVSDITSGASVIAKLKPVHLTNFFSFPGGCYDDAALQAAKKAGVQVVQNDVIGGDAGQPNADAIVRKVMRETRNGSIVTFNTAEDNAPQTAVALRSIVNNLCTTKFKCVRLSELLALGRVTYAASPSP